MLRRGVGGQHDDRNIAGIAFTTEALGQFDTRSTGKHPVQQYQVGYALGDRLDGFFGILDTDGLVGLCAQGIGDHVAYGRLVFDNEDMGLHGRTLGSGVKALHPIIMTVL